MPAKKLTKLPAKKPAKLTSKPAPKPTKPLQPAPKLSKKPLFAGQPPHKAPPPPPPVKRAPPPPPPRKVAPPTLAAATPELPADSVLHQLPEMPGEATHIMYHREPTVDRAGNTVQGLTVIVPVSAGGDFSSCKTGTVQYGRLRYGDEFIPVGEAPATPPPPPVPGRKLPPPPPRKPVAPAAPSVATNKPAGTAPKREGVCAFIDGLIMEGGRTRDQILALVMAQFPGRDAKATMTTIGIRPTHIRAKGLTPPPCVK